MRRPPTNDEVERRLRLGSPMPFEWIEEAPADLKCCICDEVFKRGDRVAVSLDLRAIVHNPRCAFLMPHRFLTPPEIELLGKVLEKKPGMHWEEYEYRGVA